LTMAVARVIEATGGKKLIFAGISLEVCAASPAMIVVGKELDAYVAVDASGTTTRGQRRAPFMAPSTYPEPGGRRTDCAGLRQVRNRCASTVATPRVGRTS